MRLLRLSIGLLVFFVAAGAVVNPALATGAVWVNVEPDDVRHGDTEQSMAVFVEGVDGSAEFVVNVTPLAAAGVDLSAAAVEADGPADVSIDPALDRSGDTALVRVSLDTETDRTTDVSFEVTLTGLETANATHTRLEYGIEYADDQRRSQTFELRDPDLPWVSPLTRTDDLLTGQRNASQHTVIRLDEVPAAEAATVRIDVSALAERNVSLAEATVTARLTDPDTGAAIEVVERNGRAVELTLSTAAETDVTIELALHGLDTRDAEPADDLRYGIEFAGAAGTMSGAAQPFGLYPPGGTPTATPPPTNGLTTTPSPPPTTSEGRGSPGGPVGSTPGFGPAAAVLALLLVAVVARTRTP